MAFLHYVTPPHKLFHSFVQASGEFSYASTEASGGVITNVKPRPGVDNVHWVGTCKMGTDPKTSVLTPFLQSHDVENLYVADGSGFIDYSEKNPTLTVMALASRCADYIHEELRRS